jgi:two-component system sensor histidine kinase ChvG
LVSDESDIDREAVEFYRSDAPLLGPEIRRALEGRYGAAWRVSPGQRSVTLYSALPIVEDGRVVGVVLVSQSTFRVLLGLYDVRSSLFRVVLASVLVAAVLSLLVSGTIVRPIRRLGEQAAAILDGRGKMGGRFRSTGRRDEIGDLARALEGLSTRLEQRIQFLDSVAADLSHEFKNPLACIRAAGDALLESETPDDRGRFGKVISDEVKRMEHLISSVREMALIDAQLDSERKSAVNMADILEHLAQRFSLLDSNKPRILMLVGKDTGRSECVVSASPERLAQVFENLLDNAVSLSPPDRPVEITLSRENGMVAATVRDHGPGIPEEHLELIFRRFFSYRPAEAGAKARHAGLGLAIAKAIVEGYGGTITAGNHPEGGALFIVKLTSREA